MRILTTQRLHLRPFGAADLPAVEQIHRHPALARFVPSAVCHDRADAEALRRRFARYDAHPVFGIPAIEVRGSFGPALDAGRQASGATAPTAVVGLIMLKPIPPSGHGLTPRDEPTRDDEWDVEIGWRVHPTYEGRGYIAEAARAVLEHAFVSGLGKVVAVTDPGNARSRRVAERIGMRAAGLSSAYYDTRCALFVAESPGSGMAAE